MPDLSWLGPLAGAALGYGAKAVQDWFQDKRKIDAEREARQDAQRQKRAERRDDLQRQTLLDLQQAALELTRATMKGQHHDNQVFRNDEATQWGSQPWPDELAEEHRSLLARIVLLRSRIRDAELRDWTEHLSLRCALIVVAKGEADADAARDHMTEAFKEVQDRVGRILREMDDV